LSPTSRPPLHHASYPFLSISLLNSNLTFFFFSYPATSAIYTLSLHDALPISLPAPNVVVARAGTPPDELSPEAVKGLLVNPIYTDRKSTRLNSSHDQISYAVFCLKKKKKNTC